MFPIFASPSSLLSRSINVQLNCTLFLAILLGVSTSLLASSLPQPEGRVLFEIHGNIEITNAEGSAQFDYAMLQDLGLVDKAINTPWTQEGTSFEGVLTRRLLERIGAKGTV